MQLVATILDAGAALAVYAESPLTPDEVWALVTPTECGRILFPANVRLVAVGDEAAPARLPADLSESIHGG